VALKKPSTSDTNQDVRRYTRDMSGLLQQLKDPDPETRRWAARDLASYPEAATALCQRLEPETDTSVRQAIATTLARLGGPRVVEALIPLLRSDDAALRNEVLDILKQLPEDVAPSLEALLGDPEPDMRIFAVNILETLRHPKVEDWLIAVLNTDAHVNVVASALDLLGEVGSEAALPAIERVRRRFPDSPFITFAAETAERRILGE